MEVNKHNLTKFINLIKYPSLTEKSINLYNSRQYTFIVDKSLTKIEIKYTIEKLFNINVTDIRTCILPIKKRRVGKFVGNRSNYKKAFIKIKEGETISELFN